MTLDEAIKHCEEVAIEYKAKGECFECGKEHEQLAEWLKELKVLRENVKGMEKMVESLRETVERYESENRKLTQELEQLGTDFNNQVSLVGWHEEQEEEYKRLLKLAIEDIGDSECCWICTGHKVGNCVESGRKCTEWRYKAEALKLLKEGR